MSDPVFVIAECGSSWRFDDVPEVEDGCPDNCGDHITGYCKYADAQHDYAEAVKEKHISNAYRMIEAAKGAGADAVKFQWTSDGGWMAKRRGMDGSAAEMYEKYLAYDASWLALLKAKADEAGLKFGCTAFLPQDVGVVEPFADFFKIAAKESNYEELHHAIFEFIVPKRKQRHPDNYTRPLFVSIKDDDHFFGVASTWLVCTSEYPCPPERLRLGRIRPLGSPGFSDHSANVIAGAVAVGAGARVCEVHFRLDDTPSTNCDFPHSHTPASLKIYIENIRTATRML